METTYCTHCGSKNAKEAKFCKSCGKKILSLEIEKKSCPRCGYIASEDEKYCQECGIALTSGNSEAKSSRSSSKENTGPSAIAASTPSTKKKKGGFFRTLGKVGLWFFGLLILAVGALYFIGDTENSTEHEADSDYIVEQGDQAGSNNENKQDTYKALEEPKSLKKAADKMEDAFREADTTALKQMLTETSLKTYEGVYAQIQPYMNEYAEAFESRRLIKLNEVFALYSFEDDEGNNFTVELTPIDEDNWKLTRF